MMVEEVVEEAPAEPAPIRIRATPKPKMEAPTAPKAEAPAAPQAEAEPVVEEAAPKARASRKKSASDDLTVIEGIGPKIAAALVSAGIDTFDKLAHASENDLRNALEAASLRFAPSLPTWAKQAAYAARGDFDGLKAYQDTLTGGRE
jgi:predicted flap endonuclease-1-like 5' DNA nuclease